MSLQKPSQFFDTVHILMWALLAIWVYTEVLLPSINAGPAFGISVQPDKPGSQYGVVTIVDFPHFFNFAKKSLLCVKSAKSENSVYSVENHLKVTRDWANRGINFAMPFAYSPTMMWLLAPLMFFSYNVAYCIFNIVGLLAVWWETRPFRCRMGVGLLSFFSPLAYACFSLGQTALISGACLLFIAEKTSDKNRSTVWRSPFLAGIALWILTAKPPLALTAGTVLIGLRIWRPLLVAGMLTFFSTIIIAPLLGAGWLSDYIQLLRSYDLVHAGSAFDWSLRPYTMANLRAILSMDLGFPDDVASQISGILWLLTATCIAAIDNRTRYRDSTIWSLGILSYLILCPHLTSTEELQIVLLIPLCVSSLKNRLSWQELVLFTVVPVLAFASPLSEIFYTNRLILFTAKLLLLFFLIFCMKTSRNLSKDISPKMQLQGEQC